MDKRPREITWITLWRILFFLALAALMYKSLNILLGLFLAIVISSGLEFLVNFLEKKGVPRTLGVILIFLLSTLFVVIGIYTIIPLLIIDLNTALLSLNKLAENSWWGPYVNIRSAESLSQIVNRFTGELLSGGTPFGAVSGLFGGVALTVSVLISAFYLSLTRDGVERFIQTVFPADYEDVALRIYERARRRIGYWFRTQILLSVIMGVLVMIALLLLGVKHALLLGLLAGVLEIVPFIGPVIAGSAAFISALISSPTLAFWTLVVFLVIHQIENHVLIPLLIGRNVGLHPVIVIMALLIGMHVGGFLGVMVSVPAAVVLQEIIEGWSPRRPKDEQIPLPL